MFSEASALLPALAFAFITPDLNVIPSSTLHDNPALPPNLQISKFYYKEHIAEVQSQLADVRALGHAAAEEWYKGLEKRGKDRVSDAERCERWEARVRSSTRQTPKSSTSSYSTPSNLTPQMQAAQACHVRLNSSMNESARVCKCIRFKAWSEKCREFIGLLCIGIPLLQPFLTANFRF